MKDLAAIAERMLEEHGTPIPIIFLTGKKGRWMVWREDPSTPPMELAVYAHRMLHTVTQHTRLTISGLAERDDGEEESWFFEPVLLLTQVDLEGGREVENLAGVIRVDDTGRASVDWEVYADAEAVFSTEHFEHMFEAVELPPILPEDQLLQLIAWLMHAERDVKLAQLPPSA